MLTTETMKDIFPHNSVFLEGQFQHSYTNTALFKKNEQKPDSFWAEV